MYTNTEIKMAILDKIKENGFKIHKVEDIDGYFLFDGDKDSVTHFYIKGLKHWKFGLWINETEGGSGKNAELFAQYDTCIDKFKPSRSPLCEEVWLHNEIHLTDCNFIRMMDMISFIKKHPLIAYHTDVSYSMANSSYLLYFIKEELIDNRLDKFISKMYTTKSLLWCELKLKFIRRSKIVYQAYITDRCFSSSKRYIINVVFKANSTDCEEYKLLKFWFRHDIYGQRPNRYNQYIVLDDVQRIGSKDAYHYIY